MSDELPVIYGVVYGLYDPRDGKLRYVGQTKHKLKKRLSQHLGQRELCVLPPTHKTKWLSLLLRLGTSPRIKTIDVAFTKEELDQLEITHIAKNEGLTNTSTGGKGNPGHVASTETRRKMSIARKGKPMTAAARINMSAAQKGRTFTAETKQKMAGRKVGRKLPPEQRAAMSLAQKERRDKERAAGKPGCVFSPTALLAMSLAKKGKRQTEAHRKATAAGLREKPKTKEHVEAALAARRRNKEIKKDAG